MNVTQKAIHDNSLKILSTIGYKVADQRILAKLAENDFRIDGTTVYFTEEQIMVALATTPSSFKLTARNDEKSIILGEGFTHLTPGYGATFITELNGIKRDATFQDYINFAKLTQSSGCLGANGGILVQPVDLDVNSCFPLMLYAALILSDLPLIGISAREDDVRHTLELVEIAFGGKENFRSAYHILSLVNTVTPLQLGECGAETLLVAAEFNQPVIITPGVSLGGTAPTSLAGALSLGNAELLATLTIVQTLKKGLPVVYGLGATVLDMKSGATYLASPFNESFSLFARTMAKEYKLPNRNGCAMTDAKCVGMQSVFESTVALMSVIKDPCSISFHSAGILESFKAMSFEQFIIDCQTIKTIRKAMEPIDISEEAMAYDAILKAGIGGNFLSNAHTVKNFRKYSYEPKLTPLAKILKEEPASIDKNYLERVQNECQEQLKSYVFPEFNEKTNQKLLDYLVKNLGVDQGLLEFGVH